jgi:hypothetical protein
MSSAPAASAHGRHWHTRPRAPRAAAVAAAAAEAARALEFPYRGSGLLWARSTGLKLWPGAVLLSRCLEEAPSLLAPLHPRLAARPAGGAGGGWVWQDKLVLELGCGLGLVACTAARLGARVVATDGDGDLLRVSFSVCAPRVYLLHMHASVRVCVCMFVCV